MLSNITGSGHNTFVAKQSNKPLERTGMNRRVKSDRRRAGRSAPSR